MRVKKPTLRIVVRMEKFQGSMRPVLFFPDCEANRGMILCCSLEEGHCEASIGYYQNYTYQPKGKEQEESARKCIERYTTHFCPDYKVLVQKKITMHTLRKAWNTHGTIHWHLSRQKDAQEQSIQGDTP